MEEILSRILIKYSETRTLRRNLEPLVEDAGKISRTLLRLYFMEFILFICLLTTGLLCLPKRHYVHLLEKRNAKKYCAEIKSAKNISPKKKNQSVIFISTMCIGFLFLYLAIIVENILLCLAGFIIGTVIIIRGMYQFSKE